MRPMRTMRPMRLNSCGEVPTRIDPQYAVLCTIWTDLDTLHRLLVSEDPNKEKTDLRSHRPYDLFLGGCLGCLGKVEYEMI